MTLTLQSLPDTEENGAIFLSAKTKYENTILTDHKTLSF